MAEFAEYAPGTPCWIDVTTPDLERTLAFYGALFGWEAVHDPRPEAGGYTMLTLRGRTVAAANPSQQDGIPPAWTTYLATDDADAAARRVREAGGSVHVEPRDVLDAGRATLAQDPTGAVFGLWQAGEHRGAQLANEPGTLSWNECRTTDAAAAEAFYQKVFGYRIQVLPMGDEPDYRVLEVDGRGVGGLMQIRPGSGGSGSHWATTFAVADADESCARAVELGGRLLAGPLDLPEIGRWASLEDPVGASFGVIASPAG